MKTNVKKVVIISSVIGAIVVLSGAIILRNKRKKLQASIDAGSPEIIEPAKTTTKSALFPLKKGSGVNQAEQNAVKVVQRYINSKSLIHWWLSINPLVEDGVFGSKTETELMKLASVKEVSYSLYKEMQNYLTPVPQALSSNAPAYKSTDPSVEKNDISIFSNLFGF
jgi:hypothetical protein